RSPADVTLANATVTGAYVVASPTPKVRLVAPVATFFLRFPTMWPLVRETVPVDEIERVLAPVVILPLVRVSVPLMVGLADRVTPAASLIVRPLNEVPNEPPTVWPEPPLRVTVPAPAVNALVDALFVQ